MRLRLLYEGARAAMLVRGLRFRAVSAPPGIVAPQISYLDGRPLLRKGAGKHVPLTVLVHGLGSSVATWANVLPAIARRVPVVAPDLPGYGRTLLPDGVPYATLRQQVDALAAFIEAVSPEHPVQLVGQSMGGWIAARYAAEKPARVSRLTLVNAAGILQPQIFEQRALFTPQDKGQLRRLWRAMWYRLPVSYYMFEGDYLALTRTPMVRGFLDSVAEEDFLNDFLARISAPTLLIWGLSDRLIGFDSVAHFRQGLPDARVRIIPKCGHVPQRERPREFLRYLLPWLAGAEPPEVEPHPADVNDASTQESHAPSG